jgi:tRNA A-37 threonylcarbamoyl transferase component Bud32
MKLVAPRAPTPVTPAPGRPSSHLPTDIVADQIQRLKVFSLVSGGLWFVGAVMDLLVFPRLLGHPPIGSAILIESVGVLTAIAIYLYVCYAPQSAQNKSDAGLWLMVLNAFDIALLETWAHAPVDLKVGQPSWITIVILLTAMILPGGPRKMMVAALISATMGPLGVWVAYLRGVPVPSLVTTLVIYLPNYTCAIAAMMPSVMFQRIGRRLREARELGSYELLEQLGHGGMGEVWRARHRLLAREAAIKLVRPEVLGAGTDDQARLLLRRFEREAQATAQLRSSHSIRLFDFGGTDDGSFYYVMELLTGRDLESLIREFGPLPADRVMFLLRQVCHSLAEAHERGLIHRDVKPANIYVCRMGLDYDFVKVLDFGLVKFNDAQASETQTQTLMTASHTMMGTPAYMAPEIILGHATVDARADVYAVGCVAYFMLTGQLVFQGGTPMQALVDHVHTPPVPPSARVELRIPPELDAIVLQCLEKDPNKRPQDAIKLRAMLHGCNTCEEWTNGQAREWWAAHLPQLAGPLTYLDEPSEMARI